MKIINYDAPYSEASDEARAAAAIIQKYCDNRNCSSCVFSRIAYGDKIICNITLHGDECAGDTLPYEWEI